MDFKQSILESLDGFDMAIYPYLPYILQDSWAIGADPETMLHLIKKHVNKRPLNILDLGCGKGAVSIPMALELQSTVTGIDGMEEFIYEANAYAVKYNAQHLCTFEQGDIRKRIKEMKGYDVVILGAIGPVLGSLYETLTVLKGSLNSPGYVLLDDGYIEDESATSYNRCLRKSEFYNQLSQSGLSIVEEITFDKDFLEDNDNQIYESISARIEELKKQHPEKVSVFDAYLRSQEYENHIIEDELKGGVWLLKYGF